MAYTLYTHEPLADLPDLAQYGFPPGTFFWTELDDAVEDAFYEAEVEGAPHVLIQVEVSEHEDLLVVSEEEIIEALTPSEEDEYEEVPEEFVEGEFEDVEGEVVYSEEFVEGEEFLEEEEPLEEEEEIREEEQILEEDWPQTIEEANLLTGSATLLKRVEPQSAIVLGEPVELVQEDLSIEDLGAGIWFGFTMEPLPLVDFLQPYWRRWFKRLFRSRGGA